MRHIEITKNPQWHPSQKDDAISKKFVFTDSAIGHVLTGVCGFDIHDDYPHAAGVNGTPEFQIKSIDLHFEDGRTEAFTYPVKL